VKALPQLASISTRAIAVATTALVLSLLGSCRVGYPFRGPGYDSERGVVHPKAGSRVVAVITRGDIKPGEGNRFASALRTILHTMSEQDGLVGYSVRKSLFGSRVWTMSVWVDRASVERFVRSPAHAKAMAEGSIQNASFIAAYVQIDTSRVPLTWSEAERMLGQRNRLE